MIALYEFRLKRNLTQTALAQLLGVTPNCITQWESGARKPNLVMLKKLAEVLECTADDLLEPIET